MTTAAFDTLTCARRLKAAGVDEAQAEAVRDAIAEGVASLRADLKTETASLRAGLKTEIANLRADLYRAMWMQAGVVVAAIVALVKLLP